MTHYNVRIVLERQVSTRKTEVESTTVEYVSKEAAERRFNAAVDVCHLTSELMPAAVVTVVLDSHEAAVAASAYGDGTIFKKGDFALFNYRSGLYSKYVEEKA